MRLSSCHATGKMPFGNRNTAKKAAKSMTSRFGDKQRVYQCPHCHLWHLTTNKK